MLSDNNRWGVAQVEYGMGTLARARGDAEMAVRYYHDAMEIFRELDAWPEIARCQAGIGWIALASGDFGLAGRQPGGEPAAEPGLRAAARHRPRARGVRGAGGGRGSSQSRRPGWPARPASCASPSVTARASAPGSKRCSTSPAAASARSAAAALFAEGREMTAEDAVSVALGSDA